MDVTSEESVEKAIEKIVESGRFDGMIANAGMTRLGLVFELFEPESPLPPLNRMSLN